MVIWIIGLSGAGKTSLAEEIERQVRSRVPNIVFIDGDVIREIFANDLGHTLDDRRKNADRISKLCKFLDNQGVNVVCSILSLFHESQDWNREHINNYYEVYIEASIEKLIERDSKGLYKKALKGELNNVAGIDLEFLPPVKPDLFIRNESSISELLSYAPQIVSLLQEQK